MLCISFDLKKFYNLGTRTQKEREEEGVLYFKTNLELLKAQPRFQ